MGKRSDFERFERDFYPTPRSAVLPLLPHLNAGTRFCEPCAGNGALIDHLTAAGHVCARAWDIEPQRDDIDKHDALTRIVGNIDCFITNPPWRRRAEARLRSGVRIARMGASLDQRRRHTAIDDEGGE